MNVTQPVANSVDMCVHTDGVLFKPFHQYKVGGFAADTGKFKQFINAVRYVSVKLFKENPADLP